MLAVSGKPLEGILDAELNLSHGNRRTADDAEPLMRSIRGCPRERSTGEDVRVGRTP